MNERVVEAFDRLMAEVEEPPTWSQISSGPALSIDGRPAARRWGAWAAAAAFALVAGVVGGVLILRPSVDVVAGPIDHIRLEWSEELDLRCDGMEIEDNGGFGQAVVEIWGPSSDGFWRLEVTYPDGSTDIRISQGDSDPPLRVWGSDRALDFREASCSVNTVDASSSYVMSNPPVYRWGFNRVGFIPTVSSEIDGFSVLLESLRERDPSPDAADYRGIDVEVFVINSEGNDEFGARQSEQEYWIDVASNTLERIVFTHFSERLGSSIQVLGVTERDSVSIDEISFETEGLFLLYENPGPPDPRVDESVTTTSSAAPSEIEISDEQARAQISTWVNQLGLMQTDPVVWRQRLLRACTEGVWDHDVALRLAEDFIGQDLELSPGMEGAKQPTVEVGAQTLWIMAVNVCADAFPEGTIQNGPPSF